jgi:hypothetical protein
MSGQRRHPWEAIYPPGLDWRTEIATGTLTDMLDEAVAAYGDRPAFEFNDRRMSFASGTAVSATIPIRGTKGMPSGEPTDPMRAAEA